MSTRTLSDVFQRYLNTIEDAENDFVLIRKKTLGFGTSNPCTLGSMLRNMPSDVLVSAAIYSTHFSTTIFEQRVNNSNVSDELTVSAYKYLIHSYYSNQSSLPFYGVFPIHPCVLSIQIRSLNQPGPLTLVFMDDRAYRAYYDMMIVGKSTHKNTLSTNPNQELWPHDVINPLKSLLQDCLSRRCVLFEDTKSGVASTENDISPNITNMTDTSGRTLNDILKRSLLRSFSSSKKQKRRKSVEKVERALLQTQLTETLSQSRSPLAAHVRERKQWALEDSGDDVADDASDDSAASSVIFDENTRATEPENVIVLQSMSGPDPFLENMGCHVEMGAEALGILLNEVSERFHDDLGDDVSVLTENEHGVGRRGQGSVVSGGLEGNRSYCLGVTNSCTEANVPNMLPIILPGISRGVCTLRLFGEEDAGTHCSVMSSLNQDIDNDKTTAANEQIGEVAAMPFAQVWLNGRALPPRVPCKVQVGDVLIFGSLRYSFRIRRVARSSVIRILPTMNGGNISGHCHHSSAVILRTEFNFSDPDAIRKAATQILAQTRLTRDISPGNHLHINPCNRHTVSGSFEETMQVRAVPRSTSTDEEEVEAEANTSHVSHEDPLLRIFLEELKSWCFWLGCKIRINVVKNVVLVKNKRGHTRRKTSDILTFTGFISTKKLASRPFDDGEDKFVFQHRCINEKGEIMQLVQKFAVYGVKCQRTISYLMHQGDFDNSFANMVYKLSETNVEQRVDDAVLERIVSLNAPGVMAKFLVGLNKPNMDRFEWIKVCAITLLQHDMVPYHVMDWHKFGDKVDFSELFSSQLAALWINKMDASNRLVIVELTLHCCILLRLAFDCFKQSAQAAMPSFNDMFNWMYKSCYNDTKDEDVIIRVDSPPREAVQTTTSVPPSPSGSDYNDKLKMFMIRRTIEHWHSRGKKLALAKSFMSWKWFSIFLKAQEEKQAKRRAERERRRSADAAAIAAAEVARRMQRANSLSGDLFGTGEDIPLPVERKDMLKDFDEEFVPLLTRNKNTLKRLYAHYARVTLGTLMVNQEEDGVTRHMHLERMWGLLKDFEVCPLFCNKVTMRTLSQEQSDTEGSDSDTAMISLNGFVKILIGIADSSMLVEGRAHKLGALFRVMNRSNGRGKIELGLPAFAEFVAPQTPSPRRVPRKRMDTRLHTNALSSDDSLSTGIDTADTNTTPLPSQQPPTVNAVVRDRRPSLSAPAAAQDLQASVFTFMDSLDPYSPLEPPPSTDTIDGGVGQAKEGDGLEAEECTQEGGDDDDGISVLSEYTWQNAAVSSLFPRVTSAENLTTAFPEGLGLQVHSMDDEDAFDAPNMLSAMSITQSSDFGVDYEDLPSPLSLRNSASEEADLLFQGKGRRRRSVGKSLSLDDGDDMSVLSFDNLSVNSATATSSRSRVKSVPRQPIKQPIKPAPIYGVTSSNITSLRSIIRQAAKAPKPPPSSPQQKLQTPQPQQKPSPKKRNSKS